MSTSARMSIYSLPRKAILLYNGIANFTTSSFIYACMHDLCMKVRPEVFEYLFGFWEDAHMKQKMMVDVCTHVHVTENAKVMW